MLTIQVGGSTLLLVDLQARLMPSIDSAAEVIANARRLRDAAKLLGMPTRSRSRTRQALAPRCRSCRTVIRRLKPR